MKNSRRNDVDDDDGSIFRCLLQPLVCRLVLIVYTPYWRNTNTTTMTTKWMMVARCSVEGQTTAQSFAPTSTGLDSR